MRPPMVDVRYMYNTIVCPPVGLAYVAAAARDAGHDVEVIDAVGEAPNRVRPLDDPSYLLRGLSVDEVAARVSPHADVVGVSCMFSQDWPHLRGLLDALRRRAPGAVIVAGGEHVTALPEHVLADGPVDHCVLGEGEETFVDLLDALAGSRPVESVPGLASRAGGGIRTAPRARIRAIDSIAPPAWDLFPIDRYLAGGHGFGVHRGRSMPIVATRGCPYRCTFCSSPDMWTTRWSARDPDAVLREMFGYVERYGARNFDFYDLTAIVKRDWIVRFCRSLIERRLDVTWQLPTGTRSEAIDEEVAELLARAGCRNITYAPESGSPSELERIGKRIRLDRMKRSIAACVRRGLYVKVNIVIGFRGQTARELLETLVFLAELAVVGARDVIISIFSPYPGSHMYRELRAAGRIGPPDDRYFLELSTIQDLSRSVSWAEALSARQLGAARWLGNLLFYGVSFALRPSRPVATLVNVVRGREEANLDRALVDLARRAFPGLRRVLASLVWALEANPQAFRPMARAHGG
ncbi:MAG: B12-binding domain-containing radical SAM protein [Deltaproteobacteria bacterium]|nr:B12-binding domain-containing radical SAM protein [Deltaproteobacteria bacterium]